MLDKLKTIANTEDKKRLLSNFFSLSILQGLNYLLPLLTFPYLVRVLGVEYFGFLAFVTATISYFQVITDYGFNLTATRDISIHREDKAKLAEIFSSVMTIKILFMILSFILLSILLFSFDIFTKNRLVYFLTFGTVIGQVLFPVWFFQGIQRMKYVTYLNILAKAIFTVAIFLFVKKQSDFMLVPVLNSLGFIVAGIWSLLIVVNKFSISFEFQTFETIKTYLKDGWYVFLSQFKITLFSQSNIVILGLLTNNIAVGYYSAAEKLMRALAMLQTPITGALFPYMAKEIKTNKLVAIKKLKKIISIGTLIYSFLIIVVFIYAKEIITLIYTIKMIESANVLRIIVIIPLTIFLNNIYGTQIMLNTGKEREFFNVLLIGAIVNLILCPILSYKYSYIGTAVSLLIVEVYIMIGMYVYVKKGNTEM